jgi:hypothetical protein
MADDRGQALQWLVRALGRRAEGRSDLDGLYTSGAAPLTREDPSALLRRAAALGLVAYRGPDQEGRTEVWLTVQGEQALGSLQAMDDADGS